MGKSVTLKLEKDGETKEITFKTSGLGLIKGLKHINGAYKQGWALVDVSGDADMVSYIKKVIGGHNPFNQGVTHGVKELAGVAGLKNPVKVPGMLKRLAGKKVPGPETEDPGAEAARDGSEKA